MKKVLFVIMFAIFCIEYTYADEARVKVSGNTVRLRDGAELTLSGKSYWDKVSKRFKGYKVLTGEWDKQNSVSYKISSPGMVYMLTDKYGLKDLIQQGWEQVDTISAVIYQNDTKIEREVFVLVKEHEKGEYHVTGGRYMIGIRIMFK
jgi:hypothetical protein